MRDSIKRKLTYRELQVLTLAAQGFLYKEIANRLGTKEQTVKNQMASVLVKMGTNNSRHAVHMARDQGLI